jgi:hypothetical protein
MALSVLNHKWWPDVVLKQDKPILGMASGLAEDGSPLEQEL